MPVTSDNETALLSEIASQPPYSLNGSILTTAIKVASHLFLTMSESRHRKIQDKLQIQKTGKILLIESIPALFSDKISRSEFLQKKASLLISGLHRMDNYVSKRKWRVFFSDQRPEAGYVPVNSWEHSSPIKTLFSCSTYGYS